MFVSGVNTATAMRIARYQAEALQEVDRSAARISSNRRFTSFAEDPVSATREISLRAQQGTASLYLRATQDAKAAADAASGGLQQASEILLEMYNQVLDMDANDASSQTAAANLVTQLNGQLDRIAASTKSLGGDELLDGSLVTNGLEFTIAASGSPAELNAISVTSTALSLNSLDFTDKDATLAAIKAAQEDVAESLATTGGMSSTMGYHATALASQVSAFDSAIENLVGVDVAEETLNMTRNSLRAEASAAMLAQVNALHYSMVRQLLMSR